VRFGRPRRGDVAAIGVVAALAGLALPAAGVAAKGPKDAIRVGSLAGPNDNHVAIVGSRRSLVGKRFKVVRGNRVVDRGKLDKLVKGADPSPWPHGAAARLRQVPVGGPYRVRVGRLESAKFRVANDAASRLVARLQSIFRVNADGAEPNPVFGPAHLNDAAAPIVGGPTAGGTIDVAGGWRDAGDAIKFTYTIGISSVLLDYAAALDPANAASLRSLSEIGIRYLEKAHPAGTQTFIAQVSGSSDHTGGFRDFATDDASPNPAFSHRNAYGDAGSGSLGAGAAALASASLRSSPPRAMQLRNLAEEWYARGQAVSGPGPALEDFAQPGGESFSDWQGFMALAAAALYRAGAGNASGDPYLSDAIGYLNAANVEGGFSPYFTVGGLAAADLCGGLALPPVERADVRTVACGKLGEAVRAAAQRQRLNAFGSPGGFYFGWASDHGGSGALLAAGGRAGIAFGAGVQKGAIARDYLLGRNPWGVSFLVGPGKRDAKNPHHPVFLKGKPAQLGDGFVVGGPALASQFGDFGLKYDRDGPLAKFNPTYRDALYRGKVVYEDRRQDFITSEVGIAYSASAILLAALLAP
jgi:hypothetical protein